MPSAAPEDLRSLGEAFTQAQLDRLGDLGLGLRQMAAGPLRRSLGLRGDPPPPCEDPERSFLPPTGAARQLHGDLAPMLIGGVAALLLQTLHPLAMAGVAQHSDYERDPLGRLQRTAFFVGTTTFGSTVEAERSIKAVRAIHARVTGTASDGRPYAAQDPELLGFVHATEVWSFLAAARRFGAHGVSPALADAYVDEMAKVAVALGATEVPRTEAELEARLAYYRPELVLSSDAERARRFLLRGVATKPHEVAVYALIVASAIGLLPSWARGLLRLPVPPLVEPLWVRPAALTFAATLRLAVPPTPKSTLAA